MGKNDAVFEVANQVITGAVQEAFYTSADNIRRKLRQVVDVYARNFYRAMSQIGLPSYSGGYPAYSLKYADRKLDLQTFNPNLGGGFYQLTGDLKAEILGRDPVEDFGEAIVRFSTGKGGALREGFRRNRAGRIIRASGLGRGQFASALEAIANLEAEIEVGLFRKIQGRPAGDIFNVYPDASRMVSIPQQGMKNYRYRRAGLRTRFRVNEFGGPRGQKSRPLLIPFLDFYTRTGLNSVVKKAFF